MATEKQHEPITQFIEKFLDAVRVEGSVEALPLTEKKYALKITTKENQGYLIGKQGATLEAIQHFVTLLARAANSEFQYRVDVNNYQQERDELFLKRVAEYVDEKRESIELLLWPMSPYERRLVHEYFLALGTHTTVSEDFGSKRVVRVIKK